jgi:hypothetical protein
MRKKELAARNLEPGQSRLLIVDAVAAASVSAIRSPRQAATTQ